jgi:hypothetical protein
MGLQRKGRDPVKDMAGHEGTPVRGDEQSRSRKTTARASKRREGEWNTGDGRRRRRRQVCNGARSRRELHNA